MVKKWSDLKLADEKALRRKKRERSRQEKQKSEDLEQKKAKAKMLVTFGAVFACIGIFVLWLIIDWGRTSSAEMEKMKTVIVTTKSKNSSVQYDNGTTVTDPPLNVEKKITMAETKDGEMKLLLKDNTSVYLRKNSRVKLRIIDITSKMKLVLEFKVLKGSVFIKSKDRSEFRLETANFKGVNTNFSRFHVRVNSHRDDDEILCEYGNFELKSKKGSKELTLKPSQKIMFTTDGKVDVGNYSNFHYYE